MNPEERPSAGDQSYGEGGSRYLDGHPGIREAQPRIYVKIRPAGIDTAFFALLDTGGHFCILNEQAASLLQDGLTETLGRFSMLTWHGRVDGELYTHGITLVAEFGQSLDVDATVLVPSHWTGPCILGYAGALERVRFAINPGANRFYFGAV